MSSAGGVIVTVRIRLGGVVLHAQHSSPMQKNEENVLVIRRTLFDELGAFQGLERDADRYIETFMTRRNNFFLPRSRAERDPAFKQIIPYVIFTFEGTILRYVRGAKSGEKRLVDKGSIGIGGHINDGDESLFSFDKDAYRAAVHREVTEELNFEGMWQDRLAALINDDSTEVGQVHLGMVHVVELRHDAVRAREKAIRELCFLAPEELRKQRDKLESWSQIVLDAWETL
jgi:predicted NUDIX family phosphoesterase